MSSGPACKCAERNEPFKDGADGKPGRLWRWLHYKCNYSAFSGYHYTPSDYSLCACLACGAHWRTKSDFPIAEISDFETRKILGRQGSDYHKNFLVLSFRREAKQ